MGAEMQVPEAIWVVPRGRPARWLEWVTFCPSNPFQPAEHHETRQAAEAYAAGLNPIRKAHGDRPPLPTWFQQQLAGLTPDGGTR